MTIEELRTAWERGALAENDGHGGTRSNRNVDIARQLRVAIRGGSQAMTTRETPLEAIARRSRCAICGTQPRVAWLPMLPLPMGNPEPGGLAPYEYRLRCECYPQGPTLENLLPSELSKAIADPAYPTDALTRMQAERIREKMEKMIREKRA